MSSTTLPKSSNSSGGGSFAFSIIAFTALCLVGGFVIATVFTPMIFPVQASTQAVEVDRLFWVLLFLGGAIFLFVEGLILFSVLRFRAKPGDLADGPPIHGSRTLELIWTAIPCVIVTVLVFLSVQVWNSTHAVLPNEQAAQAVAARFAWTFNYTISRDDMPATLNYDQLKPEIRADLEDEDGVITFSSQKLYTWVNQPVVVTMTTQDVNHAFWVPAMRVKQDVLAGRETTVRFTPTQEGVFRVVCAELCGSGHGAMAGEIVGEGEDARLNGAWVVVYADEAEFLREFYEPTATAALLPPDDPALVGRAVLASGAYPCATCHVLPDLGWAGNIGPSLVGIGDRAADRAESTGDADAAAYLVHSIRLPADYLVPGFGNLMPQFNPDAGQANYMSENDLNAIVAYLLTQTGS
jgi:cytochrome c oxidase subunit II